MCKITAIVLAIFISITTTAHISRKEVKAAKAKYKQTHSVMDRLYWRGLHDIRHDQKIPAFLRKK